MKKPATHKKHTTGIPGRGVAIVEHLARAVAVIVLALAGVLVVASCTENAFDCNAQPEVCL